MQQPLFPRELLLLAQAVYREGAASFDVVSRLMASHPANAGRQGLFTPAACLAYYRDMLATEGLDSSQLPTELKRPNARIHLVLARKYYSIRLLEMRDRLAREENKMRNLSQECEGIQEGLWDAAVTASYILLHPSPHPENARYAHQNSGSLQSIPSIPHSPKGGVSSRPIAPSHNAGASSGNLSPSIKNEAVGRQELAEVPLESVQSIASNSTEVVGFLDTLVGQDPMPEQLAEIPEEPEDCAAITGDLQDGKGSGVETVGGSSRGPVFKKASKGPLTKATKPMPPERRSSTRATRLSISNLNEIAIPSPVPPDDFAAESGMFMTEASAYVIARDPSPTVFTPEEMSRETSNRRGARTARRSSVPRESNKRKRTATPQAQGSRGHSPTGSDRSRSKRVKTEEAETSIGTPTEHERTPFSGSDASAAKRFKNSAPHLIAQMQGSVFSTYFKDPVKPGEAVNYFEIIKRPMDLKTLSHNVRSGKTTSSAEFARDIILIFANAIMYNGLSHHVGQDAMALWREAQQLLRVLEAAELRLF